MGLHVGEHLDKESSHSMRWHLLERTYQCCIQNTDRWLKVGVGNDLLMSLRPLNIKWLSRYLTVTGRVATVVWLVERLYVPFLISDLPVHWCRNDVQLAQKGRLLTWDCCLLAATSHLCAIAMDPYPCFEYGCIMQRNGKMQCFALLSGVAACSNCLCNLSHWAALIQNHGCNREPFFGHCSRCNYSFFVLESILCQSTHKQQIFQIDLMHTFSELKYWQDLANEHP